MKKTLIIFLLIAFAAVSLFADSLVVWCSEKQVDFIKKIGTQFTKDTGIQIDVQFVNFGDIKSKYLTAAQAGEGPDIIVGAHDWVGELTKNGLLDPLPMSGIETDKYAQSGLNAFTVDGKLYGLPYAVEAVAMIYNKDYYPEPPKTAEDLISMAKEYTTDETLGFVYDINNFYFSYGFLKGFGGYVFDWSKANGYDVKNVGLNNEGSIKGGKFLLSLMTEGIIPQGANSNTADSMFKEGLAGMIINGPWALTGYIDAGIDFGVVPLTEFMLEDGHYAQPFVGVQGLMVNARSSNKAIAKEFVINYLATKEGIYQFYLADPRLPARDDVLDLIKANGGPIPQDIVEAFIKSAAGGEPMPNVPEMSSVWTPVGDAISNITGETQTVEEALNDAVSKILSDINK